MAFAGTTENEWREGKGKTRLHEKKENKEDGVKEVTSEEIKIEFGGGVRKQIFTSLTERCFQQ